MSYNKTIFEVSTEGRKAYSLPKLDVPNVAIDKLIPSNLLRGTDANLPQVSELDVVRHFTNLGDKNYSVDKGFYPLGSCTMKYNPKINEDIAKLSGFANIHPLQNQDTIQGALQVIDGLSDALCEVTGMDNFTLAPAAGAHGEYVGLLTIAAYHQKRKDTKRTKIIVPDSAHGTNPASAMVAGFEIVEVTSLENGLVDLESLKSVLSDEIAGLMLTNPNTLGLFDTNITEIARLVHECGGLLYYDGANLNAVLGKSRPGDMGFDVCHLNLHKTFSTPHGGGGPGSGPVGVKKHLAEFLPTPVVVKNADNTLKLEYDRPYSVGTVKNFYGNFAVYLRAYVYILSMGGDGLKAVGENAVLNANYLQQLLKENYNLSRDNICMHETVFAGLKEPNGVSTVDVAKRIIDYGYHPPTVYFPLIVKEALMFEPTETEGKDTLDAFAEVLNKIAQEAKENPELLKSAPHNSPIRRLDQTKAAKDLKVIERLSGI